DGGEGAGGRAAGGRPSGSGAAPETSAEASEPGAASPVVVPEAMSGRQTEADERSDELEALSLRVEAIASHQRQIDERTAPDRGPRGPHGAPGGPPPGRRRAGGAGGAGADGGEDVRAAGGDGRGPAHGLLEGPARALRDGRLRRDAGLPPSSSSSSSFLSSLDARNGYRKNGYNAQQQFLFILNRIRCPR
ncbi:unnamed protein product, partial [Prorocentrum cordatum]